MKSSEFLVKFYHKLSIHIHYNTLDNIKKLVTLATNRILVANIRHPCLITWFYIFISRNAKNLHMQIYFIFLTHYMENPSHGQTIHTQKNRACH